jgi:sigma-E factor negative regulatory protein RseB
MRRALAAFAAACVALPWAHAQASPEEAREWLARMTESLAALNYDGLFTHSAGRQSEAMRIVHRVEDGRSLERLVSLDGSGREIVRTSEEVHLYMPDRRVVLVEPRSDEGSLLKALPGPGAELDALYTLETSQGNRLLGRDVQVVVIRPRDAYRYGYRLWLDAGTAMPLRSEVLGRDEQAVEAIHFTKLETGEPIELSELEPEVDASGFQWVRTGRRARATPATPTGWRPAKIPRGFRLVTTRLQPMPGQPVPAQHLVFSDGVASVSVFIEPGMAKGPAPPESTSVGSANAFSTQVQGHVVTAVGEVPPATVREIATSLAPIEGAATPDGAEGR